MTITPMRLIDEQYTKTPFYGIRRITTALQWIAVKFNDWLIEGKDPEHEMEKAKQANRTKNMIVREFYPLFMKRHGSYQSKKTQESYHNSFKNVCRCPSIAESFLSAITKQQITDYMRLRIENDNVTAATVNREAVFVKGMLSRATE